MNRKKRQALSFLPLVIGTALFSTAQATTLSYSKGDLLMGFYDPSASQTYLVDIGAASTYRDATSSFTLNIGNIAADLSTVFGSNWNTSSSLMWGVFGTIYQATAGINGDPNYTLYASAPEPTIGQEGTPWSAKSANAQANVGAKIQNVGAVASSLNYSTTANSNDAVIEGVTDSGSFASYQTNNGFTSFSYFNGALGGGTNAAGSDLSTAPLDLFRMTTANNGNPGTYEGTFSISSSGVVTFDPQAVPEPSTVASIAFGGIFLLLLARHRRTRKQIS